MADLELVNAGDRNWASKQNANLTALNNAKQEIATLDEDVTAIFDDPDSALRVQTNAAIAEARLTRPRYGESRPVVSNKAIVTLVGTSTLTNLGDYLEDWIDTETGWGLSVANMGVAGGRMQFHMARMGVWEVLLSGTIPASGSGTVTLSGVPTAGRLRDYTVTVGGIVGTLEGNNDVFTFERATPGAAVTFTDEVCYTVPTDGELSTALGNVAFLNIGKNNAADGFESIVSTTEAIIDTFSASKKYVVLMGHFNNTNVDTNRDLWVEVNEWCEEYASTHDHVVFADLSGYLTGEQVWIDTGITPTVDDLAQQAAGDMPESLASEPQHLNATGYAAVAAHVAGPAIAELLGLTMPFQGHTSDTMTGDGAMHERVTDIGLGGAPLTWSAPTGSPVTTGGVASFTGTCLAQLDVGEHASVRIGVEVTTLPATGSLILSALKESASTSGTTPAYRLQVSSAGALTLVRRDGSGNTTLDTASETVEAGDRVELEIVRNTTTESNAIRALLNDVEVAAVADSGITSGEWIAVSSTGSVTFDDFDALLLPSTS